MKAKSGNRQRRLFFALWPDSAVRDHFRRILALAPSQGRGVALDNLHLTLAFLGEVGEEQAVLAGEAAARVQAEKFTLTFDHLGYFPQPQILWLGVEEVPGELTTLRQALLNQLQSCGLPVDRKAFVPHVSLVRNCPAVAIDIPFEPFSWQVEGFCLVESVRDRQGAKYRVLAEYG